MYIYMYVCIYTHTFYTEVEREKRLEGYKSNHQNYIISDYLEGA